MTTSEIVNFMNVVRVTSYQLVGMSKGLEGENKAVLDLVVEITLKAVQEQLFSDDRKATWSAIDKGGKDGPSNVSG